MSFEVMKVGIFKGSSYVITHTDDGLYNWYCGYVEVPKIIFTMSNIMMILMI